jgi:PilZ domain-containing protein
MGPTRKEARIPAVVPVRISAINEDGDPISCLAHTLNVSKRGARLASVNLPTLRSGMVVRIVRGRATANFRVVWIGSKETKSEFHIGVECLEMVSNFWGLEQTQPVSADAEREGSQRRTVGGSPSR